MKTKLLSFLLAFTFIFSACSYADEIEFAETNDDFYEIQEDTVDDFVLEENMETNEEDLDENQDDLAELIEDVEIENTVSTNNMNTDAENVYVSFRYTKDGINFSDSFNPKIIFDIYSESGEYISSFTSGGEFGILLNQGTYVLKEQSAPSGYISPDGLKFIVYSDGNIWSESSNKVSSNGVVEIWLDTVTQPIRITGLQEGCVCTATYEYNNAQVSEISPDDSVILDTWSSVSNMGYNWNLDIDYGVKHESLVISGKGLIEAHNNGKQYFDIESNLFSGGNIIKTIFVPDRMNYEVSGKSGIITSGTTDENSLIEFLWYPEEGNISITFSNNSYQGQASYKIKDILNAIKSGENAIPSTSSIIKNPFADGCDISINFPSEDSNGNAFDFNGTEYGITDTNNNVVAEGSFSENSNSIPLKWKEEMGTLKISLLGKKLIGEANVYTDDIYDCIKAGNTVTAKDFQIIPRYHIVEIPVNIKDVPGANPQIAIIDNNTGKEDEKINIAYGNNEVFIDSLTYSDDPDLAAGYTIRIESAGQAEQIMVTAEDLKKVVEECPEYYVLYTHMFTSGMIRINVFVKNAKCDVYDSNNNFVISKTSDKDGILEIPYDADMGALNISIEDDTISGHTDISFDEILNSYASVIIPSKCSFVDKYPMFTQKIKVENVPAGTAYVLKYMSNNITFESGTNENKNTIEFTSTLANNDPRPGYGYVLELSYNGTNEKFDIPNTALSDASKNGMEWYVIKSTLSNSSQNDNPSDKESENNNNTDTKPVSQPESQKESEQLQPVPSQAKTPVKATEEQVASENNVVKKMAAPKIKTKKKKTVVSWKKAKNVNGYQIQYSLKKNFKNAKIKKVSSKKSSAVLKGLKKGKTYYVRLRAYKKSGNTVTYGKWSNKKKIKVK